MMVGDPHPTREGYYLVGFCYSYYHKQAKRRIYSKSGRPMPIWKRLASPPPVQLSLI